MRMCGKGGIEKVVAMMKLKIVHIKIKKKMKMKVKMEMSLNKMFYIGRNVI